MNGINILKSNIRKKENTNFRHGDIVTWTGRSPCICRIDYRNDTETTECYHIDEMYVRLSVKEGLRWATPEEVKMLGNKQRVKYEI